MLEGLIGATRAVSLRCVWLCGGFLIVSVLLIGAEVILRKLGLLGISGATEIGGYMLATSSAWAFSFTLLNRSNIRFDALYSRVPPRGRALLDLCGLLFLGAFAWTLTSYAWGVLTTSIALGAQSNSDLAVPLWLPQSLWVGGLSFLCWTIALLALRVLVAIAAGDPETVFRLAGIEMAAEEMERETRGIDLTGHVAPFPAEARD
jgi:TRAP-type mannitol/chloroaromatic compound transport system permease small subunit